MKEKLEYDFFKKKMKEYQVIVNKIASGRMIAFLIMISSFIFKYYYYPKLFTILFFISLFIFVLLVIIHDRYYKIYDYYTKYVNVIKTYLDRENGNWKQFKDTGSDFLKDSPYYYSDLDLFGDYSLFQYLNICKTRGGRNKLRKRLSNLEYSKNQLKEEQEAIMELSHHIHFMIDFSVLLSCYDDIDVYLSRDFSFDKPIYSSGKRDFVIAIICSSICFILLLFSILGIVSFRYFYGMFLFNFMMSYLYAYIFRDKFSYLEKMIIGYRGIRSIFQRCIQEEFQSRKMKSIQKDMIESLECISDLGKLDTINSFKSNIISNFFGNGFFGINFILLYLFSKFQEKNLSKFKSGISHLEELEAMCSLANVGVMFDNKCIPILDEEIGIHFDTLIHPLLGEKVCVANDFDSDCGVNIITGSNMGGKTSFLRTIGVNLILMNSGTFVCAKNFHASYFKIFTSMRVADDIERGISTFYGELLRIKDMVDYVNQGNMFVFIDEIFKGTNYQDRIYGAKEVIRRLNNRDTIVMLTTHDFELCEEENVRNYHVKEFYDGDKIVFDYKIRLGQCTSTNARYLMKKLGIVEK